MCNVISIILVNFMLRGQPHLLLVRVNYLEGNQIVDEIIKTEFGRLRKSWHRYSILE